MYKIVKLWPKINRKRENPAEIAHMLVRIAGLNFSARIPQGIFPIIAKNATVVAIVVVVVSVKPLS